MGAPACVCSRPPRRQPGAMAPSSPGPAASHYARGSTCDLGPSHRGPAGCWQRARRAHGTSRSSAAPLTPAPERPQRLHRRRRRTAPDRRPRPPMRLGRQQAARARARRERRCWCLTAVVCCKWSRPPKQDRGEKRPPYARLAELFAQARPPRQRSAHRRGAGAPRVALGRRGRGAAQRMRTPVPELGAARRAQPRRICRGMRIGYGSSSAPTSAVL